MDRDRCYSGVHHCLAEGGGKYDIVSYNWDPRKGYVIKQEEVVGVTAQKNLRHMELPLCSGVPFQL
jgi:hypothetical protein